MIATDTETIKKILSEIKLGGWGYKTDNLWEDVKTDIPEPTQLIAQGSDSYSTYAGNDDSFGSFFISDGKKAVCILGTDEYFAYDVFDLTSFANEPTKKEQP